MRLLAKVEAVFTIPGRGTVIVPEGLSDLGVRNGDPISLRAPDGQTKNTHITAVESLNQGPGKPRRPAFMLPVEVAKQEVAQGTEIWSMKD